MQYLGEGIPSIRFDDFDPETRVRIEYFKRDARISVVGRRSVPPKHDPPERSDSLTPSKQCLARLRWVGNNNAANWASLLTLTYPETWPVDGAVAGRHLENMLRCCKRLWPDLLYFWVREFQKRNAPHWHVLFTVRGQGRRLHYRPKKNGRIPLGWVNLHRWASLRWQETISGYGSPAGIRAGIRWEELDSAEGGAAYLASYAAKPEQKKVPPGFENPGRWWGHSQAVAVPPPDQSIVIPISEYLRGVEGPVANDAGWLFSTLHNGRERAHRWLVPASQQQFATVPTWEET